MSPRAINMAGFTLLPVILAMSLIAAIAFLLNRDSGMNAGMIASQSDADRARYTAEAGLQAVNAIAQGKNCTGYTNLPATALLPPIAFGADSYTATVSPASGTPVTLTASATTAGGASASLTRANVVMHQPPVTLTLQPGVSGSDTYIRSTSSGSNYGADASLSVQSGMVKALVGFDLSPIPAGSTILSAQLSLYHTAGGNDTVSAYRVTRPWTEGTGVAGSGATWNSYNGVNAWTAAGGDYDTAAGVAVALSGNNTWATWDLTAQTAAWTAGTQSNYGIALVASTTGNNTFVSSDDPVNTTMRPKLIVTYALPCGWVPPAPPETVVILPAIKDTWIDETGNGSANYGGSTSFTVTNAIKSGRGLVKFDLSSIAADTLLKSATLRLFIEPGNFSPNGNPTSILTVNRAYDPWVEGTKNGTGNADGATWKTRDGNNAWSAGFGSYWGFIPGPTSTSALSSTFTSGSVEWDVTAMAQEWLDGVAPNYGAGVLIDTSSAVIFNSREFTANQPQLVITY